MIGTALRSLSEEGGSSQEAISAYIVANFDDLPWGHDKLLPYYLRKLTEQGEFVAVAPGRYSIAGVSNEPKPGFPIAEGDGDVLRTPEPKRDHVDVIAAQATTRQNAEAGTSATKRRGRPPKRNRLSAGRGTDGEGGTPLSGTRGRRRQTSA